MRHDGSRPGAACRASADRYGADSARGTARCHDDDRSPEPDRTCRAAASGSGADSAASIDSTAAGRDADDGGRGVEDDARLHGAADARGAIGDDSTDAESSDSSAAAARAWRGKPNDARGRDSGHRSHPRADAATAAARRAHDVGGRRAWDRAHSRAAARESAGREHDARRRGTGDRSYESRRIRAHARDTAPCPGDALDRPCPRTTKHSPTRPSS